MITSYSNSIRGYAKALFAITNKLNLNSEYLILLEILSKFLQISKVKSLTKNNLLSSDVRANFLINLMNDKLINQLIPNFNQHENFAYSNILFNNFIKLLAKKKQLLLIPKIFYSYEQLYLTNTNSLKINLTTAVPLEPALKSTFNEKLFKYFKKNLLFSYTIDQSIIAGLIINYKDQVIDYSLKGKLLQLKELFKND